MLQQLGMMAGNAIIGGLMGQFNDDRQYNLNAKLLGQQAQNQNSITEFNFQKQLELWEKTNYPAQIAMMKKAGLNPAMMYGMGGGGGSTANIQAGHASGGQAAGHSGEMLGMMNLSLMDAQRNLLEAQARETNVRADKTEGVDTTLANAQIKSLAAGVTNTTAQTELLRIDKKIKSLDLWLKDKTLEDQIKIVHQNANLIIEEVEQLRRNNDITEAQEPSLKLQAAANLALTYANTALAKSEKDVNVEKVKQIVASIINEGRNSISTSTSASANERNAQVNADRLAFEKQLKDLTESERAIIETVGEIFEMLTLKNLISPAGGGPIKGFRR